MTLRKLVTGGLSVLALHCSSGDSKGDAKASGSPSMTATSSAAAAPGKATTKDDFQAAYKAVFQSNEAVSSPREKLIDAYVARVGEPTKKEAGKRIWSATDGADCYKVELADDGMLSMEKIFDEKVKAETCKK